MGFFVCVCVSHFWLDLLFLVEQNFPTLCVPPEAMVPKVLINPQFSFGEMSKTAIDMKEHLDDICKKELSKISKTGLCQVHNMGKITLYCKKQSSRTI